MIKAGYSESTAKRTSGNASVKIIQAEIVADIQKKITVDSVLAQLNYIQTLAIQDEDFSTATRCEELKGKWLAMFTEKTEITIIDQPDNQFSLERLSRLNQKAIPQVVGRDE